MPAIQGGLISSIHQKGSCFKWRTLRRMMCRIIFFYWMNVCRNQTPYVLLRMICRIIFFYWLNVCRNKNPYVYWLLPIVLAMPMVNVDLQPFTGNGDDSIWVSRFSTVRERKPNHSFYILNRAFNVLTDKYFFILRAVFLIDFRYKV
jgi:hypothetical protein